MSLSGLENILISLFLHSNQPSIWQIPEYTFWLGVLFFFFGLFVFPNGISKKNEQIAVNCQIAINPIILSSGYKPPGSRRKSMKLMMTQDPI